MQRLKAFLLTGTLLSAVAMPLQPAAWAQDPGSQAKEPQGKGHKGEKASRAAPDSAAADAKGGNETPRRTKAAAGDPDAPRKSADTGEGSERRGKRKPATEAEGAEPKAAERTKASKSADGGEATERGNKRKHKADGDSGQKTAPSDAASNAKETEKDSKTAGSPSPRERASDAAGTDSANSEKPRRKNAAGRERSKDSPAETAPRDAAETPRNDGKVGARDRDQATPERDRAERRNDDRRDNDRKTETGRNDRDRDGTAADARGAPGPAGGFLPPTQARGIEEVRRDRREVVEGDRTYIREPGRTIIKDGNRTFIVHDEVERFRNLGYDVRRRREGRNFVDIIQRPGGEQIVTYTDDSGRMIRRVRRFRDGREVVLITNVYDGRPRSFAEDVVVLAPPPMRIPRERYIVDYRDADPGRIYETLSAPPVAAPPQRYTLDQVRYSPDVRNYVRSVDINTINFDTGSWDVPQASAGKLDGLAAAIKKTVDRNPNSVFLVEGYTDAVGNPTDNLSLSDRRAQSVAAILTKDYGVPPENLTTQGYGAQNPKEQTDGPSAANRRVVVRNVTQLLAANGDQGKGEAER